MNWTITVRPTNPALTDWTWTAIRDDQESVLYGEGHSTSASAINEAQTMAQEYEDGQGIIKDNSFSQVFEPVLPSAPEPEPTPEP